MRSRKITGVFIFIFILLSAVMVVAAPKQTGVPGTYHVTFTEAIRVADTLLPKGNYEIEHVMQGSEHIMVFRHVGSSQVAEVRAKCTLVPLPQKAAQNETHYMLNAANERVLQELVFRGDSVKHVF